jgi:hypothetical protein
MWRDFSHDGAACGAHRADHAPQEEEGMSVMDPAARASMMNRVREIILRPKAEWLVIDKEVTTISQMYRSYVVPLAAIGPIAAFLGAQLFGTLTLQGTTVRPTLMQGLVGAIISYALSLVAVYVVAMVIDNLAPQYGGTRNMVQAFKVSAYSSTAQWLAGAFAILPALSILGILGLYGIYLLYLGLPVLMKAPAERATAYTITVIIAVIVVFIVISIIAGLFIAGGAIATL